MRLPHGGEYTMFVDTANDDPVTRAYLAEGNGWVNSRLVSLMAAIVKPGDRVIDLGAFAGEFSLTAAALGCQVIAVEGNSRLAAAVAASAEVNSFDNMRVLNIAAGDTATTVRFWQNGPWGQVLTDDFSPANSEESVLQVPLDAILAALDWDAVGFMKVDIEGSEMRAFLGASGLLSGEHAPVLLFESNLAAARAHGTDPRKLLQCVEGFGYTLYRVTPFDLVPAGSSTFQPEVVSDYLGLKGISPETFGLTTRGSVALPELVRLLCAEATRDAADHRMIMAWHLASAPKEVLQHPDIRAVLARLKCDPDEQVRAAARWHDTDQPTAGPSPAASTAAAAGLALPPVETAERALRLSAETRLAAARALYRRSLPGADEDAFPVVVGMPGPLAMAVASRLTLLARRHPVLALAARRIAARLRNYRRRAA
jgi:FkbM family methyltransferase